MGLSFSVFRRKSEIPGNLYIPEDIFLLIGKEYEDDVNRNLPQSELEMIYDNTSSNSYPRSLQIITIEHFSLILSLPENHTLGKYQANKGIDLFQQSLLSLNEEIFKELEQDLVSFLETKNDFDEIKSFNVYIKANKNILVSYVQVFRHLYWLHRSDTRTISILEYIFFVKHGYYQSDNFMKFIKNTWLD